MSGMNGMPRAGYGLCRRTELCMAALLAGLLPGSASVFASQVIAVDRTLFPNTVLTYDTADPLNQTVLNTTERFISSLDYDADAELLYAIDEFHKELLMVDDETGVFTHVADLSGLVPLQLPTGLAIDPTDGTFYVASTNFLLSSAIYTLNSATGVLTLLGMNGLNLTADIAISAEGVMYALDSHTDSLYIIDKTDGTETLVGPTGFAAGLEHGMDFDYSDGTLYANIDMLGLADSMRFVTIDTNTGAATEIARSNQENMNMAVKAAILPPAPVGRSSATEKGSLIVYPRVEVRWENAPPYNVIQDTFLHLTNDYPAAVDVKLFFVNGDAPVFAATWNGGGTEQPEFASVLDGHMGMARETGGNGGTKMGGNGGGGGGDGGRDHPGWNHFDNIITLTANEPAYWAASTGLPKGVGPWQTLDPGDDGPGRPDPLDPTQRYLRGFVVAFAVVQTPAFDEIRWNHLAGDAAIVNYREEHAWQYNAESFQVNDPFVHGQPTGTPGVLMLDGFEYVQAPALLHLNFIASNSDAYSGASTPIVHDTDVALLPVWLDLRQETTGPRTTKATFDIWNENEVKFTNLDECITCWTGRLFSEHAIPNHFLIEALHTDAGRVRIDGVTSGLCAPADARETALLGVATKLLTPYAASGQNLVGLGSEDGLLRYDVSDPPPESNGGPQSAARP